MTVAYLSLGSNIGNREAHLADAIKRLESAAIRILRRSSIYETEPQDLPGQPWFLNQVIEIETDYSAATLLASIQKIEAEMGRERLTPKGPRTIDIDILFYGNSVIHSSELEVPHPRLADRRFVLEPLAELAPDLRHPVFGKTIQELLPATHSQIVHRK